MASRKLAGKEQKRRQKLPYQGPFKGGYGAYIRCSMYGLGMEKKMDNSDKLENDGENKLDDEMEAGGI